MPKRFRGHGWSKKGSKKSRAKQRELAKKKYFHAVAVGRRPVIFDLKSNAREQIDDYEGAVYERFDTLEQAQEFMKKNRITPPAFRTPIPPCRDTTLPPPHLNPEYSVKYATEVVPFGLTHKQIKFDICLQLPSVVQVAPFGTSEQAFARVRVLAERIARDPMNKILDPPSFECKSATCGYCTGDPWCQRFLLLKRLYQLNATLPLIEGDAAPAEGDQF